MPGPHDLFARFTFGHPERAMAELRAALPSFVVSRVDWSTLRRESGSVVDPRLRETQSDLLFSARLKDSGRELLLYVLLEHQSSVDGWMAFRVLRYVVRLLDQWRESHAEGTLLPVVVPLVMYHGPEGAWTAPRRVEELFDLPEQERQLWQTLVPRFEYLLDDLTAEREEALLARAGPPLARLAFVALRYGRTGELASRLPHWAALFSQFQATPEGQEDLVALVHYLWRVGDRATHAVAAGVLHSVMDSRRAEELMLTVGERRFLEQLAQGFASEWTEGLPKEMAQAMEKGVFRGLEKWIWIAQGLEGGQLKEMIQRVAKARAEYVLKVLASRDVQVDESARQRILECTDIATVDEWFERALSATRLSDVLGD